MDQFARDEDRKLREDRDEDEEEADRITQWRHCEGRCALGIIVAEGTLPTVANAVFPFQEVTLLMEDTVGGTVTVTPNGEPTQYAYNIGQGIPVASGTRRILFHFVAHGWVFNY